MPGAVLGTRCSDEQDGQALLLWSEHSGETQTVSVSFTAVITLPVEIPRNE